MEEDRRVFIFRGLEMWVMMCRKILYVALLLLRVVREVMKRNR